MPKSGSVRIKSEIRINSYDVIKRAIEEGVAYGITRAWKHSDNPLPSPGQQEDIERAVINSLCEVIIFEESGGKN